MDQVLGMLREIFVAVVGGLLSSLLFVYVQRNSDRAARRRFELDLPEARPTLEKMERVVVRGGSAGFLYGLKHVVWFLVSLVLVGFSALVLAAVVATAVDYSSVAHAKPASNEPSGILVFVFSIPLFIMSIRAQLADRFIAAWLKFTVFGALGVFLAIVLMVAIFGTDTEKGFYPWPDRPAVEGPMVGLFLLLELLLSVLAQSHWPRWGRLERRAEAA